MDTCGFYGVGAGRSYQIGKVRLTFKPFIGQGDYSLCESSSSPGSGAGLHRHPFDEWHIILEGSYECRVGDETCILGPGEMMFAAGGVPHGLKNLGPGPGRQITISSPADRSEAFFSEVAKSGVDSGNPSKTGGVSFREIAAKHGVEFLPL